MTTSSTFADLGLSPALVSNISDLGYERPTPIQAESIPIFLKKKDILAQAQTGTGKTAAFALPILSNLQLDNHSVQAMVITPTRELAIQVAEAFQVYARGLDGFLVTPIYGGQSYTTQLKALKRGPQVVVGTPGRVMDHIRRGKLSLDTLQTIVLDEADEMLKMGFVEDVEWILSHVPSERQTALFSATLPSSIQNIAKRYLQSASRIHIKPSFNAVEAIEQSLIRVQGRQKLDLLTRLLELEPFKAVMIFTRTKNSSTEVAERLQARGYSAAALNGDMNQDARKKVVERIKKGSLDIIVATDVAARGIDVERVSHVVNYDIPHDAESYVHRIGRTGRAGRKGKAFLFVAPREQRLLKEVERAINKPIKEINPPTINALRDKREQDLFDKLEGALGNTDRLEKQKRCIEKFITSSDHRIEDVAAALLGFMQASDPLPSNEIERGQPEQERSSGGRHRRGGRRFEGDKKRSPSQGPRRRKPGKSSDSKPASFAKKKGRPPKKKK